ncbi:MAG: tagatose 1,6-diphosphate aldolase [Chloroflexota bacterium]
MPNQPTATFGKYRHLSQCSSPAGRFNILAIDHRDSLLTSLNEAAGQAITLAEFVAFKSMIMRYLLPAATAVLTDPEVGFGPAIVNGSLGGQVGLLSPLEITNYTDHPSLRVTNFIPDWSVRKIKRIGGAGVKLLLYYHPDAPNTHHQRGIVARLVEECAEYDIPFFLEPMAYSLDKTRSLSNSELRQIVIENVRTFSNMGIDVIKIEFPLNVDEEPDESVWTAALQELNAACAVPWTLLSAGIDYATFRRQCELACAAGASGIIAGRAIWAEAVQLQGETREQFLSTTARQRMDELAAICNQHAVSWREKIIAPQADPDWYKTYNATADGSSLL